MTKDSRLFDFSAVPITGSYYRFLLVLVILGTRGFHHLASLAGRAVINEVQVVAEHCCT